MLQYVGETSPECQLYPDEALNVPFHSPAELPESAENSACKGLMSHRETENDNVKEHTNDVE